MIFELKNISDLALCVNVIRNSFSTVTEEFGITHENAPTNPAFIDLETILNFKSKGVKFFGYFKNNKIIGTVGIENPEQDLFYIEKLGILPEERHNGYGKQLMDFAIQYIRDKGGKRISVAIINENIVLKKWYRNMGFIEIRTRRFENLPFKVCFLEMLI